jgi:hypothetical protein
MADAPALTESDVRRIVRDELADHARRRAASPALRRALGLLGGSIEASRAEGLRP